METRTWYEKLRLSPVTKRLIFLAVLQPVRDRKEWRREENLGSVPLSFAEIRQREGKRWGAGVHPPHPHPHPQFA